MTYGLTDTGYTPRRESEWLALVREDWEDRLDALGLPHDIDWTRKSLEAALTAIVAARLAELDAVPQAIYNARDINNATGINLDTLVILTGVRRLPATYSTVSCTMTGTTGVTVTAGKIAEGGGIDGKARWLLQEDVTFVAGTATGSFRAETIGQITAGAGTITTIVTPVTGWTAVTNGAAASAGRNRETNTEFRQRRLLRLARAGSTSTPAILANVLACDGVTAAIVLENDRRSNQTIEGKVLPGGCVNAIVYPNTLTTAQQQTVMEEIYERTAGGVRIYGTDVTGTVTAADGFAKVTAFDWGSDLNVAVVCTVTLEDGYVIGDVQAPLQDLIIDYFAAINVGQEIYRLDIDALAATVDGIGNCTTTLNGGVSVTPNIYELPVLNPSPPTVTT